MKFCKKRKHSYIGLNGIETSFHYILLDDVKEFHGEKFFEKWRELVKNKPLARKDWYYYDDYKFAALQADSYLNPIS
jgi:hypothetical protein